MLRSYEKVDMVGHQHVDVDSCPMPLRGGQEAVEVTGVVILSHKDRRAVVPALDDMLGLAGQKVTGESCHLGRLDTVGDQMDKSSLTPFFCALNRSRVIFVSDRPRKTSGKQPGPLISITERTIRVAVRTTAENRRLVTELRWIIKG